MAEIPVSGAVAEYHGQRIPIMFSSGDWIALAVPFDIEIPDAFARGTSRRFGHYVPWAKVPRSAVDGVVSIEVTGTLAGQSVSLSGRLPDGRIVVWFIGSPAVAREIGLEGDQHMGWSGMVDPDDLRDIRVEETRRS